MLKDNHDAGLVQSQIPSSGLHKCGDIFPQFSLPSQPATSFSYLLTARSLFLLFPPYSLSADFSVVAGGAECDRVAKALLRWDETERVWGL